MDKWEQLTKIEDKNDKFMKSLVKPCPKCKKLWSTPTECLHLKCPAPCNYEWCWLCEEKWEGHNR